MDELCRDPQRFFALVERPLVNLSRPWGHWWAAAYYAGAKLGGVSFPDPTLALVALAVGWALLTPILVMLSERFDGYRPDYLISEPRARRYADV